MSGRQERSPRDIYRSQTQNQIQYEQETLVRTTIEVAHKMSARNRYDELADLIAMRLIPALNVTPEDAGTVCAELKDENLSYNYLALREFIDNPTYYRELFNEYPRGTNHENALSTLEGAFDTFESVAILDGYLSRELTNYSNVYMFSDKIKFGTLYDRWGGNQPEKVQLRDPDSDASETAVQGAKGEGKSATTEAIVESLYARNTKVLDILDWMKCENVYYDVRSERADLRKIRLKQSASLWWNEVDGIEPPDVEVYMPVTTRLSESKIPVNQTTGETIVKPFTIPVSELPQHVLKAALTHTTKVQSSTIEQALKRIEDNYSDDWSLSDLHDVIQDMDVQDGVKQRIGQVIDTLQRRGYIRDKRDDHTIDWSDILYDTGTITSFSVSWTETAVDKYIVMLYLMSSLRREVSQLDQRSEAGDAPELPRLAAVFRELHKIASPDSKGRNADPQVNSLKTATVGEWEDLAALNRHVDMELIADSQQWTRQVHNDVRSQFNKGLTLRNKYKWVENFSESFSGPNDWKYLSRVSRKFDPGEALWIGDSYDATDGSLTQLDRPWQMTLQVLPPMSHHIETKDEGHGLLARAKYVEEEELEPSPWDATVPQRLRLDASAPTEKTAEDYKNGARFAHELVKPAPGEWIWTDDVAAAYNKWARSEESDGCVPLSKAEIGDGFKSYFEDEVGMDDAFYRDTKMVDGQRGYAYFGVELTDKGRAVLEDDSLDGSLPGSDSGDD